MGTWVVWILLAVAQGQSDEQGRLFLNNVRVADGLLEPHVGVDLSAALGADDSATLEVGVAPVAGVIEVVNQYDAFGRLVSVTQTTVSDAGGSTTGDITYDTYDEYGRRVAWQTFSTQLLDDGDVGATILHHTTTYDRLGRIVAEYASEVTSTSASSSTITSTTTYATYDTFGRIQQLVETEVTGEGGPGATIETRTFVYNQLGQVIAIFEVDHDDGVPVLSVDPELITVVDPDGNDLSCAPAADATLAVEPAELSFFSKVGAGLLPAKAITVTSSDGSAIAFVATTDVAWLSATPSEATTPASVDVQVDATGLTAGPYSASVTIAPDGADAIVVPVSLLLITSEE